MSGNRGKLAHDYANEACQLYRRRGRALVSFAGPEWVNVRPLGRGQFQGIQQRGPVDYIGHDSNGWGFRFDLKASHQKTSLDLGPAKVPKHQVEELLWCSERQVAAGLLVARFDHSLKSVIRCWYWLPARELFAHFEGVKWGRIRWEFVDELVETLAEAPRLPTLDVGGMIPDFLDAVTRPYYTIDGRAGGMPARPSR